MLQYHPVEQGDLHGWAFWGSPFLFPGKYTVAPMIAILSTSIKVQKKENFVIMVSVIQL